MKPITTSVYTFENIIQGNYLYVDKTDYIHKMVKQPQGVYCLSRPGRFGKSLMISTLKALFEGKRELFHGLLIDEADYDWKAYPVIHIDFGKKKLDSAEDLQLRLVEAIFCQAKKYDIMISSAEPSAMFEELIEKLSEKGKVVILIDEYDKPVFNNLDNEEDKSAIQKMLKGFYSVIKGTEEYQRFVMLTGVCNYSHMSVFADLNNLEDLTMDKRFAQMLGYTQSELQIYFNEYITTVSSELSVSRSLLLEDVKKWYNGYRFHHSVDPVYNPVSTMKFFESGEFRKYWFETGTPSYLIKLIKRKQFDLSILESDEFSETFFLSNELDRLEVLPLLFQTGHITIKGYHFEDNYTFYKLGFPNREVESAFNTYLADHYCNVTKELVDSYIYSSVKALREDNLITMFDKLKIFFSDLPTNVTLKNEKYFQTILYVFFTLMKESIEIEMEFNHGQIDVAVFFKDRIYIFEFLLEGAPDEAVRQIREMKYYLAHQGDERSLILIGAVFDPYTRTIDSWLIDELS